MIAGRPWEVRAALMAAIVAESSRAPLLRVTPFGRLGANPSDDDPLTMSKGLADANDVMVENSKPYGMDIDPLRTNLCRWSRLESPRSDFKSKGFATVEPMESSPKSVACESVYAPRNVKRLLNRLFTETSRASAPSALSMLKRIAELEAEVEELKTAKTEQAAGDNAVTKPVQPQEVSAAASPDVTASDLPILEARHGMQFRGFGDVDLQAGNSGQTNGFQLGIFNLLMTSRLSENVGFLGELVMDVS